MHNVLYILIITIEETEIMVIKTVETNNFDSNYNDLIVALNISWIKAVISCWANNGLYPMLSQYPYYNLIRIFWIWIWAYVRDNWRLKNRVKYNHFLTEIYFIILLFR